MSARPRRAGWLPRASAALAAPALLSCAHPENLSRLWFWRNDGCDWRETTAIRRHDVPPSAFFPEPADDYLNPGAVWDELRRDNSACDVYEVHGCGKRALVCCGTLWDPEDQTDVNQCFANPRGDWSTATAAPTRSSDAGPAAR